MLSIRFHPFDAALTQFGVDAADAALLNADQVAAGEVRAPAVSLANIKAA